MVSPVVMLMHMVTFFAGTPGPPVATAGVGFLTALLSVGIVSRIVGRSGRAKSRRLAAWTNLADNMSYGLIFIDSDDAYLYLSAAAERMLAAEAGELEGKPVADVEHALRMPLLLALDLLRHGKRPVLTGRFPLNERMVVVEFSRVQDDDGAFAGAAAVIRDTTRECESCDHTPGL